MIDGLVDSYWTHWWTKQSDTEFTFYEEWSFKLIGDNYWSEGSTLEWFWCEFQDTEDLNKVPCQAY